MSRRPSDKPHRAHLLIFDCDGVLVDSEPISNRILAGAITTAGLPMDAEETAAAFEGMRLADVRLEVERRLGSDLPADWLPAFETERVAAFEQELAPVPGVTKVLEQASAAGRPMCVASQARREKTELTLGLTGLSRFFPPAALFSSTMVEHGKPAPDLFLLAAETMGFEPTDCTVIEDGVPGVRAAKRAGMRALGYASDNNGDRLAVAGAEVFISMVDLPTLLEL